jgi:hypothetical protein
MRKLKNFVMPVLLIAGVWLVSAAVGPETWHSWTPYLAMLFTAAVYASGQTRMDNISMDLEAVEEAMERLDPDVAYTSLRFRFPRRK